MSKTPPEAEHRFHRPPMSKESIDRAIQQCTDQLQSALGSYIGDSFKKTPQAWERLRQKAEYWMSHLSEHCEKIKFTDDEGNKVTPEMIADWHFEPTDKTHIVNIEAKPKYPIRLIQINMSIEDAEAVRDKLCDDCEGYLDDCYPEPDGSCQYYKSNAPKDNE